MNARPYWQFYKALFPFTISFGLLVLLTFGMLWGSLLFIVLGVPIGFLGFQSFRSNEYYFYQNLGLTKWRLAKGAFIINLLVGLPVFTVALLLLFLLFGQTSII